jgi:glycine cleavage system H protein
MNFPDNLLYTKDHEWVLIEGNTAKVGITEFAAKELGDIVYVEIETVGETLEEGDVFGSVEAVKTVSDLYLPVAGTIAQANTELNDNPEVVNDDPYGEGWMIVVTLADGASTDHLMNAAAYKASLNA